MRRSLTIIWLLVAMAVLLTAVPTAARSKIALGISDPGNTVHQHIDVVNDYYPAYKPRLWSLWSSWGVRGGKATCTKGHSCYFPTEKVEELFKMNITPVIWWQPVGPPNNERDPRYIRYSRILQGAHNKYITQWAQEARNVSDRYGGRKIMIRFAHEATGAWFPWSISALDNNATKYKKAWRHIHKKFQQVKARDNVYFIWSNYFPRKKAFPGNAVIDWAGVTILNFGAQKKWKTMQSMVNRSVRLSLKITKKPIILMEVASHWKGGNKAGWLRSGYLSAFQKHPKVRAIMYLDTNQPQKGQRHPDWRLVKPNNKSALRTYAALAKNPKFRGGIH